MGRGAVSMPLVVVGVSHETAPVEVREQLAYGSDEASRALLYLREEEGVEEGGGKKRKKKGSRPVQDPHKGNDSHVDVTH